MYAANTVGAIVGSLGTSLLVAVSLGTRHAEQLLIFIAAISGAIALDSGARLESEKTNRPHRGWRRVDPDPSKRWLRYAEWAGIGLSAAVLIAGVAPVPAVLIAYGRRSAEWIETGKFADTGRILYTGEGLNEFIAVSRGAGGELNYHAAGKVQASTQTQDMRLQLLLAHLSHLVPKHPANTLVIGCGAGITAGALSMGPGVEHITIAEIEPLVPEIAADYFGIYNYQVIRNPKVSLRVDDGRHFLATTSQTFDIITTDLVDPWVKGAARLFTREFFELAKRHLRSGGVVTQFVQLYQSSPEAVKSEIGTFVEAFPNAVIWGNSMKGQGYDLVLLGQLDPVRIDADDIQSRLDTPPYAHVLESLRAIGMNSAVDLLATYAGSGPDLKTWLHGAAINRDRNLRLQYLAGLGLNLDENGPIYREMLRYARFPSEMFIGSPATLRSLRQAFEGRSK